MSVTWLRCSSRRLTLITTTVSHSNRRWYSSHAPRACLVSNTDCPSCCFLVSYSLYIVLVVGHQYFVFVAVLSPVSIQTQSLVLRALHKRKPQETQALAFASIQSWLPLLRPSIPIDWRLRKRQPIGMLGRSSGNHDWLLANASAGSWDTWRIYTSIAVSTKP